LFCALSRGLVYISNANPACSCVYICKFQFRPIHPPSRRLSVSNLDWDFWDATNLPHLKESRPRDSDGVREKVRVFLPQRVLTFPGGFLFSITAPLNLTELYF
jgi:hypothetical protein